MLHPDYHQYYFPHHWVPIVADLVLSMVHYLVAIKESMMVMRLEYCLALMTNQKMAQ